VTLLLEARGLRKRFGDLAAVDGVDLEVHEGECVALIGPNGAGKTTALNLLSGHLQPDGGRITFRGEDVTRLPPHERVRRGLSRSFQVMTVFPELTARENLLVPILVRDGAARDPLRPVVAYRGAYREADELLTDLELQAAADVPAGRLPHGDQRRLELGIAVASRPRLCLLDEPSSGLNPLERAGLLQLVRRLMEQRGITFVVVEHDMDVVFGLAGRVVVMNRGRVLAEGPPEAIRENREVRETYLGEDED
jgi:branched-chain amino acid transport system ATP-binding protein